MKIINIDGLKFSELDLENPPKWKEGELVQSSMFFRTKRPPYMPSIIVLRHLSKYINDEAKS